MKKQELVAEIEEELYAKLDKKIDEFYKLNGRLEKVKGRIAGRKLLAEFVIVADLTIITSPFGNELDSIDYFNEQLGFCKEKILNYIEKINFIQSLKKPDKKKKN